MKINLTLGDTQLIISKAKKYNILRNQLAYLLATALWETSHTMKPVKEAYWLSESWRKKNLRYYPWYGRGYVQLTWEENYKKAQEILKLGKKLTNNPDAVMEPDISAEILIVGSRDGWFRKGHTLARYITLQKSNFFEAREIINGDKNYKKDGKKIGDIIAGYAKEYDKLLKESGYGETENPNVKDNTWAEGNNADLEDEPKPSRTIGDKIIDFIIDLIFSGRT